MKKQAILPIACLAALCGPALSQAASSDPEVDMSTLDFGARYLGSTTDLDVIITNNGEADLSTVTLAITGHKGAFSIVHGCDGTLYPNNWCTATIAFAPDRHGRFYKRLNIHADEVVDGKTNCYFTAVKLEGKTVF